MMFGGAAARAAGSAKQVAAKAAGSKSGMDADSRLGRCGWLGFNLDPPGHKIARLPSGAGRRRFPGGTAIPAHSGA
jgi:hypothetical protein